MIEINTCDIKKNGIEYIKGEAYRTWINPDTVTVIHPYPFPDSKWSLFITAGTKLLCDLTAEELAARVHVASVNVKLDKQ